jgi:hypothetical protein
MSTDKKRLPSFEHSDLGKRPRRTAWRRRIQARPPWASFLVIHPLQQDSIWVRGAPLFKADPTTLCHRWQDACAGYCVPHSVFSLCSAYVFFPMQTVTPTLVGKVTKNQDQVCDDTLRLRPVAVAEVQT